MAKVLGKYTNVPPKDRPEPPQARTALETPDRNVIFGTRKNRKNIAELAAATFVFAGLVHLILAWNERPFSVMALLFSAFHGGLLGMLIGQLIWVYPDRVMIAFASIGALLGEVGLLAATGRFEPFRFNRDTFQAMIALAFWFGFIGFWVGFILFAKRLRERWRFHEHLERMEDIGEAAGEAGDGTLAEPAPEESEAPAGAIYPEADDRAAQELFPGPTPPAPQKPEEDQYLEPEDEQ